MWPQEHLLPNASQKTCITMFYQTCMVCAAASDFLLYRFFRRILEISPYPSMGAALFLYSGALPRKTRRNHRR